MTEDFKDLIGKKSPDSDSNLSSREREVLLDLESGKYKDKEHEQRGRNKGKSKQSIEEDKKQKKQKWFIRKYTGNGTLSLHESTIISGQSTFLRLTDTHKPQYVPDIETANKLLYSGDTIDTQNPLPYIFNSVAELEDCLGLASKETFETLYSRVESIFKKYVNAEEHYITILSADVIYSYFQDKFGTTHYNIFIGDNGSGKNSALLVFKYLGYRVFYGLDVSAPNYFTFLGETEECQGSTAEDEAEDIGYDREKQKIVKGGYCSGATVAKVDLSAGRKQDAWLTYCHKWFAMEELPEYKRIKGILDRSLVYNFVVGKVSHNIKDVIRCAGDAEYRRLYDELIETRKLLFAFRLMHYDDAIPEIKVNVIHRNAELTKPLLRLFSYRNDSPVALDKIRLALSKFILGRNESKKNSIESKLLETINNLYDRREEYKAQHEGEEYEEFKGLESAPYSFYNEHLWAELKDLLDGKEIPGKSESFYSTEYGAITHKRITGIYKSKLKAEPFRVGSGSGTRRGLRFSKEVLDKLDLYYDVPSQIVIEDSSRTGATDATDATHYSTKQGLDNDISGDSDIQNHAQIDKLEADLSQNDDVKDPLIPSKCVASVASVADINGAVLNDVQQECTKTEDDQSDVSDSQRITSNELTISGSASPGFGCYYDGCSKCFSSVLERVNHIDNEHPGKLHYPTQEDFENRLKPNR